MGELKQTNDGYFSEEYDDDNDDDWGDSDPDFKDDGDGDYDDWDDMELNEDGQETIPIQQSSQLKLGTVL